jgi:tRNA (guanine37-N1)-methyltransferase
VRIDIITLFPGMFEPVIGESMMMRAREKGLLDFCTHDLRDWSDDPGRRIDDRPYGGGPGMVMEVEPIVKAVRSLQDDGAGTAHLILTSPAGRQFDQAVARELANLERLVIITGHYEGVDQRVSDVLEPDEISIGDYVLTGGEIPAMVMIDAVVRLIPGVLGAEDGTVEESFEDGLLEAPQYTRPVEFEGHRVPAVLRSGNHAKIAEYRREQARKLTAARRPDLLEERQ